MSILKNKNKNNEKDSQNIKEGAWSTRTVISGRQNIKWKMKNNQSTHVEHHPTSLGCCGQVLICKITTGTSSNSKRTAEHEYRPVAFVTQVLGSFDHHCQSKNKET